MKIFNFKSLFLACLGFAAITTAQAAVEQVVATVNGQPILQSQVTRALGRQADNQTNRLKALDNIIDDMLVKQAIAESGVKVSAAQVTQAMEMIAAQNGLTYGQLLDALDYQGIRESKFRADIANQILMSQVRQKTMGKTVDVTREQVEALSQQMFEQAKNQGNVVKATATEYKVRHILLKLNPMLNDAQAKAQLIQIKKDILAGKTTFAKAAEQYSKDYLSGANGGELDFSVPEAYASQFAQTIVKTQKGMISEPFKTEFGWHILEVMDTRQGDQTELAYRQKAYETLVNQQLQEEARDWGKALRKTADIKYLVK